MSLKNVLGFFTWIICFQLVVPRVQGQNAPVSNKPDAAIKRTPASQFAPVPAPGAYTKPTGINYVRTREAIAPISDESLFDAAGFLQVKQTTEYIDGLGRPLQIVSRAASPGTDPKDAVAPVVYDNLGREVYKYLPYVKTNGPGDGSFKINPFIEQETFYKSIYKDANNNLMYDGEQFLYNKTEYEPSPLNRVTKVMAPGNSWAGSNKGVEQQYLVNTSGDAVRIWNISYDPLNYNSANQDANVNIPSTTSIYQPGELYKDVTLNEDGNAVVEYKDKEDVFK